MTKKTIIRKGEEWEINNKRERKHFEFRNKSDSKELFKSLQDWTNKEGSEKLKTKFHEFGNRRWFTFEDKGKRDGFIIMSENQENPKWIGAFKDTSHYLSLEELEALKILAQESMPEALPLIEEKINYFQKEGKEEDEHVQKLKQVVKELEYSENDNDPEFVTITIDEEIYGILTKRIRNVFTYSGNRDHYRNESWQLTNPQYYWDQYWKASYLEERTHHGSSYSVTIPKKWEEKLREEKII